MASGKIPCTCRQCKAFWTYKDEHGVEHPGQLKDRKTVKRHKRRDNYEANLAQKNGDKALTPETVVLLATMSDPDSLNFQESVAVRPRDECDREEQVSCEPLA